MIFPRNYSLFRNKNKTKAIDFNPKCIFPYKRGPHTHCVYSTESVLFLTPRVNSSFSGHCKNSWLTCNTTQEEVLLSSATLLYLKKIQKCFLFTLTLVLT